MGVAASVVFGVAGGICLFAVVLLAVIAFVIVADDEVTDDDKHEPTLDDGIIVDYDEVKDTEWFAGLPAREKARVYALTHSEYYRVLESRVDSLKHCEAPDSDTVDAVVEVLDAEIERENAIIGDARLANDTHTVADMMELRRKHTMYRDTLRDNDSPVVLETIVLRDENATRTVNRAIVKHNSWVERRSVLDDDEKRVDTFLRAVIIANKYTDGVNPDVSSVGEALRDAERTATAGFAEPTVTE